MRRIALVAFGLVGLYAALGFLAAPYALERLLAGYADARLQRRLSLEQVSVNPFALSATLRGVDLREADGGPLASAARLYVNLDVVGLFGGAWRLRALALDAPVLRAEVGADGTLNLARLLSDAAGTGDGTGAIALELVEGRIAAGRLELVDRTGPEPARTALEDVNLTLRDLATHVEAGGRFSLSLSMPQRAALRLDGELSVPGAFVAGRFALRDLAMASAWPWLGRVLALAPAGGRLDAAGAFAVALPAAGVTVRVDDARIAVADLELRPRGAADERVAFESVTVEGLRLDLAARELLARAVRAQGGRVAVRMDAAGRSGWQDVRDAHGSEGDAPFAVRIGEASVGNVSFDYRDLRPAVPLGVSVASLDVRLRALEFNEGARAEDIGVRLTDFDARLGERTSPALRLAEAVLEGGRFDVAERSAGAAALALRQGEVVVTREDDGRIDALQVLAALRDAGSALAKQAPWRLALERLRVAGIGARVEDRVPDVPASLVLAGIELAADGLHNGEGAVATVELTSAVAPAGRIEARGTLAPASGTTELEVQVQGLALAIVDAYLRSARGLGLTDGTVSASGALALAAGEASYEGDVDVERVSVEVAGGERLAACDALRLRRVRVSWPGPRLQAERVAFEKPFLHLEFAAESPLALARLIGGAERGAGEPPEVALRRLEIRDGKVLVSDRGLAEPLALPIEELAGVVTGVSADPKRRASLELAGRVGDHGTLEARGELRAFAPTALADIDLTARGVSLALLSPYTAELAGWRLEGGRLDARLDYRVRDAVLEGENVLHLEDVVLGARVADAKNAVPLDLAVALLADREGNIDVRVPVTGDLADPKLDLGDVVGKAIGGFIGGIVSAPFKVLGGLLGGAAPQAQLDRVLFAPGVAALAAPEAEKLAALGRALAARPALGVRVHGAYAAMDARAIARRVLRREVALAAGAELGPQEQPGPPSFSEPRTAAAVEELAEERLGPAAVARIVAGLEPADDETAARARALFDALLEAAEPPPAHLEALARERAEATATSLAAMDGIGDRRVTVADTVREVEPDGTRVPARLEVFPWH